MKSTLFFAAITFGVLGAGAAVASDRCNVPLSEWQPREALQQKLEAEGWKVKRIKTENGCYEAYALDRKGGRIEAYFNPKTFEIVKAAAED